MFTLMRIVTGVFLIGIAISSSDADEFYSGMRYHDASPRAR